MLEQAQAQAAIKSLNGKELLGKEMSVNEARPRSDEGRTGEGEWIIAAAETVIDLVLAVKEVDMVQRRRHGRTKAKARTILGTRNPIKLYVRVAERNLSPVPPPDNKKLLCLECFRK